MFLINRQPLVANADKWIKRTYNVYDVVHDETSTVSFYILVWIKIHFKNK